MAPHQIKRNAIGKIITVNAPNGKPSILFKSINKFVKDKEKALSIYGQVYTPSFKKWFGDWEKIPSGKNIITQPELVTLQNQIIIEDGHINYKELKAASDTITSGFAFINSLSLAEESGRTRGGIRNVEASLITGANERANPKKQADVKRTNQEKRLVDYAKKSGSWIDEKEFPESEIIGEGAEAKLFNSPENGYVRKVVNYRKFSNTPDEFLTNRISLHNYLFPETAYELIGFTTTEDFTGRPQFAFVVEQPYVTGRYIDYYKEEGQFRAEVKKRGFDVMLEQFKPKLFNESYIVRDLHTENIIYTENSNYTFIDTVPTLNNDDGKRQYGDGLLIFKLDENGEPNFDLVFPIIKDNK